MDEKKVREAIEDFKKLAELLQNKESAAVEHCNIAIEALEKQLPKKPTYEGDGYAPDGTFVYDTWECPNCGECYEVDYDDYDYCPNCGQRIDREEEENERTREDFGRNRGKN